MQIMSTKQRVVGLRKPKDLDGLSFENLEDTTVDAAADGTGDGEVGPFEWIRRENCMYVQAVRIAPDADGKAAFLEIEPVDDPPEMTEPVRTLLARIESTDSLIRMVTPADTRLARFTRLRGIALVGLVGREPDPATATHLLDTFRAEDLTEDLKGSRNAYIVENLWKMGLAGLVAMLVGFVLWIDLLGLAEITIPTATSGGIEMSAVLAFVAAAFFGVTGFAIGDIFTSLWAGQTVYPDTFRANRRYRFSGWLRLTFGVALWIAVLALLAVDWLILGVGGVTLNQATNSQPLMGFVGGLVVALAFDQAGKAVGDRSRQAFQTDSSQGGR